MVHRSPVILDAIKCMERGEDPHEAEAEPAVDQGSLSPSVAGLTS